MNLSFFKKLSPKKRGATIIIGLGLSVLLITFAVGVGSVVRNTTGSIKAFKNQWQAQLATESVKEKLLLVAKTHEAGYSMDEDACETEAGSVIDPTTSTGDRSVKCTVEGKNVEPVENILSSTSPPWFTVPNANTGDAGFDCSPLRKFTTISMLERYYNTDTADANQAKAASLLFGNDPLNHSCNWGKLKFGNNFSGRVVVPLYYEGLDANLQPKIINPKDGRNIEVTYPDGTTRIINSPLSQLKIRVRTPCLPIAERDGSNVSSLGASTDCRETTTGAIRNIPECRYEDICKPQDRYILRPLPKTSDSAENGDATIVVWQISGECTINGDAYSKETCAMIPNSDTNQSSGRRSPDNSEIYESLVNNFSTGSIQNIDQTKFGVIAYYGYFPANPPTILNFLTLSSSDYVQADSDTQYTAIDKPLLQLSISVDDLKDIQGRNIPYLEYQVVTNVPVSNTTQEFKTEINYGGQSFQQSYSIEQKKNVVDFALQD